MADDDITAFFNKKKKGKKSNAILQTDDLAEQLEQTVKQQEEFDRRAEEEKSRHKEKELTIQKNEDPEWLDPIVPDEIDIGKLNITEMPNREECFEDESEKENLDSHKTWSVVDSQPVEAPIVEEKPKEAQKYVPIQRRLPGSDSSATPNIKNDFEFPSLSAAAELEIVAEKRKKQTQPTFTKSAWGVQKPSEPVNNTTTGTAIPKAESKSLSGGDDKEAQQPSQPPAANAPAKYVPPHLRNKT